MTRAEECNAKLALIRAMLAEKGLVGVIIKKQPNFSWITAGGRGFIGLFGDMACAMILVTADATVVAANNIELPRLLSEELPGGVFEPVCLPWPGDGAIEANLHEGRGEIADDIQLDAWFKRARVQLMQPEVQRFEALGRRTADVLEDVCLKAMPGVRELEIAGRISEGLWAKGIEPITLLIAADSRSQHVRHYVPTESKAHQGFVASLCARSGGLVVSSTRIVAFADGFASHYPALLRVEQAAFDAMKPGVMLGAVFQSLQAAYADNGLPGEWQNHHQGGMTGYLAREYRADDGSSIELNLDQAFAWNPSAPGAKSEDTVLLLADGLTSLTPCSRNWPKLHIGQLDRPDVLRR